MSGFKPGDKVTPVNVYREDYAGPMERLMGKTMVVVSTSKDRDGNEIVCADVPGEMDGWTWYAQDLRLVPENQSELTDLSPTRTDFKVGDYVVPVRIDSENYKEDRSSMRDKVLRVLRVSHDNKDICAGPFMDLAGSLKWNKDDLRHATKDEILATVEPVEFKDGDLVVSIDNPFRVMVIRNQQPDTSYPFTVEGTWVSKYGVEYWSGEVSVRHATKDEIDASQKPQPLRRGDLVEYRGDVWVVYSEGEDRDGEYWISSLTGDPASDYVTVDKLSHVGNIRKKIEKVKREIES